MWREMCRESLVQQLCVRPHMPPVPHGASWYEAGLGGAQVCTHAVFLLGRLPAGACPAARLQNRAPVWRRGGRLGGRWWWCLCLEAACSASRMGMGTAVSGPTCQPLHRCLPALHPFTALQVYRPTAPRRPANPVPQNVVDAFRDFKCAMQAWKHCSYACNGCKGRRYLP